MGVIWSKDRVKYLGHQSPRKTVYSLAMDRSSRVIHILDLNEPETFSVTNTCNFQFYKALMKQIPSKFYPKDARIFCYGTDGVIMEWHVDRGMFLPLSVDDLDLILDMFVQKMRYFIS